MCIVRNERRVNGKGYSVWLRIPTGMKGLPQNRESPQFFSEIFRILGLINGKHPRFTLLHKASVNKRVICFTPIDG